MCKMGAMCPPMLVIARREEKSVSERSSSEKVSQKHVKWVLQGFFFSLCFLSMVRSPRLLTV